MAIVKQTGVMIGAGFFAGFQAEAWQRSERAKIVAVADPVVGKAAEFAARWGIPHAYTSTERMLDEHTACTFVDIATRPDTHLSLARLAARRGKHVICQKPLAPTWEDCVALVESCERAGVRLLVHENWRWQPWYREVRRLIEAGELGIPFHIRFSVRTGDGRGAEPYGVQPYFREMPQLLIYETLVHHLDTARFLAGDLEAVHCHTKRVNPCIVGEDYAVVQLMFRNGTGGLIDANRWNGPNPASLTLGTFLCEGNRGAVRLDHEGRLFITRYGQNEQEHPYTWANQGYKGDSVFATQEHLIASLETGVPSESEGREYLRTVTAVCACYQSAESGETVRLEALGGLDGRHNATD
jgi:predicted dehydrogenase